MDTKATVKIGEYSRHGKSRGLVAVKALDHDMLTREKLIPGGILEPLSGRAFLFLTDSYKTGDFMIDSLSLWQDEKKASFTGVKCLFINPDNGPECSGRRTQFLQSLSIFFSRKTPRAFTSTAKVK